MPIPDYETLMLPLLQMAGDQQEHKVPEAVEALSTQFDLSEDERQGRLPSGGETYIHNRVGWARTYMMKAGLLESTRRGHFRITPTGLQVLQKAPDRIDGKFLEQFEVFREFRRRSRRKTSGRGVTAEKRQESVSTPEETLAFAYEQLRSDLQSDILEQVKSGNPAFFERLVVELLVKMGYGGSREDAGEAVGRSGDEGIDGMIKEDRLGLDVVYVQAKRWENTVGRPELQKFAGALQGARARKGVFITTSTFSKEAVEYTDSIDTRIVLIDGQKLASLMIDHDVGVSTVDRYEIKKLDTDYFVED